MKYPKLRELKEALKCIFSRPATVKYPFGEAAFHPRYRGKPEFQDACLGCEACREVCPPGAIEIVDDLDTKKRRIIRRFDMCITCGECERICTCGEGVKMVPEFALAVFNREDLVDEIERDLVVCSNCGRLIGTKKHILWLIGQLKEKAASQLPFVVMETEELGAAEEEIDEKVTLDKRQDMFAILCPRCKHKVVLYDSL
jgi:hydrogenase-4 component H